MFIGSHVSIRKGYLRAAQEAHRIGANAYQYFPKNPRSLRVKRYNAQDARNCAQFCQENGIVSIAHAPYPTKLVTSKPQVHREIEKSILNDLEIAQACGSIGVVVHFGTYKGKDPLEGYKQMINFLDHVLAQWDGESLLFLENNAGQGSRMGTTLEEMVSIRQLLHYPEKVGFCLDTCHAFVSGLWTGENWKELERKGQELNYFTNLQAIHLNNSRYPSGSKRDRHANIHNGYIQQKQIKELLMSPYIQNIPMILETPSSRQYTHQDEIADVYKLAQK